MKRLVKMGLFVVLGISVNASAQIDAIKTIPSAVKTGNNPFPTEVIKRPFTLPSNSFETGIKLLTGTSDKHAISSLHVDYGITNDFQLGLSWGGLAANNDFSTLKSVDNSLSLNAGYFLGVFPRGASMVSLSLPFHFDSQVLKSASLAVPTVVSIVPSHANVMLLYYDLVKYDWTTQVAEFNAPIKVSWQATSQLYVGLETRLGKLSTDGNHEYIGRVTPAYFNGLFAITPAVDVIAKAGFNNAQDPTNTFEFVAGIAFRGGMLDG